jgi:hypothetical protein
LYPVLYERIFERRRIAFVLDLFRSVVEQSCRFLYLFTRFLDRLTVSWTVPRLALHESPRVPLGRLGGTRAILVATVLLLVVGSVATVSPGALASHTSPDRDPLRGF